MGQLRFRFADEEDAADYVSRLAADMPLYAPQHVLNGACLYELWRPQLVRPLLDIVHCTLGGREVRCLRAQQCCSAHSGSGRLAVASLTLSAQRRAAAC